MPVLSAVAAVFNILVCIVLPLGVFVWLIAKRLPHVLPFGVGVLTFLVSQSLLRLPLLRLLSAQPGFVVFKVQHPILYALLLGLSAGVFEEVGRYVAMGIMRRHRTLRDGLSFGMGHGGFEAAAVGLNSAALLLTGSAALYTTPPLLIAIAGIERLFAMAAHIAFSVMVMHAVAHKKPLWLLIAIALHGGVDALIGILAHFGFGLVFIELSLLAASLVVVAIALPLRRAFAAADTFSNKEGSL